ncbi:GNAT family N-acetyltransferase [Desulfobacula sp.]|uniref:GNAT family N-acetyltransferase n=1 Tax=Desulfobacula sp. TaxID=2593537 RepID=UPI0026185348|nr:GNAT family N-acetyltransferase [Desulfobacula sp.]
MGYEINGLFLNSRDVIPILGTVRRKSEGRMQIQWISKPFSRLGVGELYEVLKLRVDVFVVEQNCPYPELDGKDSHPQTLHFMGWNKADGTLAAYLRILPPGLKFKQVTIGRFVVAKAFRRQRIGNSMLERALDRIKDAWPSETVKISAQVYLKNFYESHGFEAISERYVEDGIPHIDMILLK